VGKLPGSGIARACAPCAALYEDESLAACFERLPPDPLLRKQAGGLILLAREKRVRKSLCEVVLKK
jgi:hypothetical protein